MAKPQGNDCYIDCFVVSDPELKGLFYRRAKAVYEVDMDTGYILAGEYHCSRFNFMPPPSSHWLNILPLKKTFPPLI